jgi:alcohol dehydrogenase class IV
MGSYSTSVHNISHEQDSVPAASLTFRTPEVTFGDSAAGQLPETLDHLDIDCPLVVSDQGVAEAGVLAIVLDPVERPVARYDAVTEPSTDDFDDLPLGDVDGVVAVGGGSSLDTGKLAALALTHSGTPADYLGVDAVPGPVAPLIAVPTTSGTGSQVTQTAVVTHEGVKRGISDEFLRPDVALVDPSLTVELPRSTTARSGFDAFVHALESLTARDYRWVPERPITYQGANPVSRQLSWQALVLVYGALEQATYDGTDRAARRELSLGAHLAGVAFSNAGLGTVHALASTIGGMTDRPHGECLAISFRAGLTYNMPVCRPTYAQIARALNVAAADDSDAVAAQALVDEGDRLRSTLGLPGSFADVGLDPDDIDTLVEKTLLQERRLKTNPRRVTEDLRDILETQL